MKVLMLVTPLLVFLKAMQVDLVDVDEPIKVFDTLLTPR